VSDLPGRAEAKVAWHFLDRRVRPSSKEGKNPYYYYYYYYYYYSFSFYYYSSSYY